MKVVKVNATTIVLEDIYRLDRDSFATTKMLEDKLITQNIPQWAKNKKDFYEWAEKNIAERTYSALTYLSSFFSRALMVGEVKLNKDLIECSLKEVEDIFKAISEEYGFTSAAKFYGYTSVLSYYTIWGCNVGLRTDAIKNEDFPFTYRDMVSRTRLEASLFTKKEMILSIQKFKLEQNEVVILLTLEGLTFDEVRKLKKDAVDNAKKVIVDNKIYFQVETECREVYLKESLFEKVVDVRRKTTDIRKYKIASKEMPLADTDYVFRIIDTVRSQNRPITDSTFSTNITTAFKDIGVKANPIKFRKSAILNDFLDGMNYIQINEKYDLSFASDIQVRATQAMQLEILTIKRKMEKKKGI